MYYFNKHYMKIVLIGIIVAFISGGIIISMQIQGEEKTDNITLIFGSFYPYYEFTKGVVGEIHTTKQFVPAKADIHHWVIRHQDIIQLKSATAIVYNGLGAEPYINKLIDSKEFVNVTFIDASINIDTIHVKSDHNNQSIRTKIDPHIWLDPILVKKQIQNIGEELILIDPSNEKKYRQNMLEYNERLDDLNEDIKSKFVNCKYNSVIVSHNAYEYFAQRYDIDIISTHGFTDHIEITAQSIRQFIDTVREKNIKFIIDDDARDSRMVQILGDEIGIDILYASTIESINSEEEITYFDKMKNIAHVFKTARGCN